MGSYVLTTFVLLAIAAVDLCIEPILALLLLASNTSISTNTVHLPKRLPSGCAVLTPYDSNIPSPTLFIAPDVMFLSAASTTARQDSVLQDRHQQPLGLLLSHVLLSATWHTLVQCCFAQLMSCACLFTHLLVLLLQVVSCCAMRSITVLLLVALLAAANAKKDLPDNQTPRKSTPNGVKLRECLGYAAQTAGR